MGWLCWECSWGWFHRRLFKGRQKSIQRKELQSKKSILPEVGISLTAVAKVCITAAHISYSEPSQTTLILGLEKCFS